MVAINYFNSELMNQISSTYAETYGISTVNAWIQEERDRLKVELGAVDIPEHKLVHALENRAFAHITQIAINEINQNRR